MPLAPRLPGSPVRTATVIQSARMPEVMKTFSPSMTYSSPPAPDPDPGSRRAVVRRPATSDPPPGSVIASAAIFSPRSTGGITSCCSSGEPCRSRGGRPMLCENRLAMTPPLAPHRLMTTESALRTANGAGVPPSSSG
jgi:hypothetical protein